jgi:hypothetical protein
MPTVPRLEFLYTLVAELAPPIPIGDIPHGQRLVIPVTGGTFEGAQLRGKLLPGGGDWLLIRADGVAELDVRGTLATDDGAFIYTQYRGYATEVPTILPRWAAGETVPRESYYFAATPYFETGAARYAWLQRVVTVGIGELIPGGVRYEVFAVR